ncbi:RDD family protein [Microbacterium excoecariae]|uniref:RDD family protein n=1 Tax=Microbacterium excoecariae TaxID=2715210 RepID=UPI001F105652|nr:RDD family protein [Microbacterium excoecariae]
MSTGQSGYASQPAYGPNPGAQAPQAPQAPRPQVPGIATIGRRVGVYIVDMALISVAVSIVGGIVLAIAVPMILAGETAAATALFGLPAVAGLAFAIVYIAMQGGRGSFAQRWFRIRLVRADSGDPLGFGRALLRYVIWALGASIIVGYFSVFFDSSGRRQGWHDRVSGALVVDADHAPAPAVGDTGAARPQVADDPAPAGAPAAAPAAGWQTPSPAAGWEAPAAPATQQAAWEAPGAPAAPADPFATSVPAPPAFAAPTAPPAPPTFAAPAAPVAPVTGDGPVASDGPIAFVPGVTDERRGDDIRADAAPADAPPAPAFDEPAPPAPSAFDTPAPPMYEAPAPPTAPVSEPPGAPAAVFEQPAAPPAFDTPVPPAPAAPPAFEDPAQPAAPAFEQPVAPPTDDDFVDDTIVVNRGAAATPPTVTLAWDDGTRSVVAERTVFGRNPSGPGEVVAIADDTMSLSKTHFEIALDGDSATVTDLHSTNGVVIERAGTEFTAAPGTPTPLAAGDALTIGERRATVEQVGSL